MKKATNVCSICFFGLLIVVSALPIYAMQAQEIELISSYQNSSIVVEKGSELKTALEKIEEQHNLVFLYRSDVVQGKKIQRSAVLSDNIREALSEVLNGLSLGYKYINPKTYGIYTTQELVDEQQVRSVATVRGVVTESEYDDPLPGVSILVKGTLIGTATDIDGEFTLTVPSLEDTLVFSFIGYQRQEVPINGQTVFNIVLDPEVLSSGEELVVVGYGVQRKSDLTGAIAQVKPEDIENRSITRPEQALQGKTAGVQIIQTSGAPGAAQTVRIRGFSSNGTSDPLYVVDGLIVSDIGSIDPNTISSYEILKDAASAAIYGSRAGNGVVLITTKKGASGTSKVTYDHMTTINRLNYIPEVMNAHQYINYMTEAKYISEDEISAVWDGTTDTDWTDVAFEKSIMRRHNLSFTGGNDKGSYFASISYLDQDGIVRGDADVYNRVTGTINADYKVNDYIKVGTTNILEKWAVQSVSENSEYGSLLGAVLTLDPLTPDLYAANELPAHMQNSLDLGYILLQNENGYYYGISNVFEADQIHPLLMRDRTISENDGNNIQGTFYIELTPIDKLIVTSKLGYRSSYSGNYSYAKEYYANQVASQTSLSLSRRSTNTLYYQWDNYANYIDSFGQHTVNITVGTSLTDNSSTYISASTNALLNEEAENFRDLDYSSSDATFSIGGGENFGVTMSYFSRVSYNYKDTYLINGIVRRDAADASKLSKESRWGVFPGISFGYVISNEDFFPDIEFITNLKFRGSWGRNGSTANLSGYAYQSAITSSSSYPFTRDIAYQVGSAPNLLGNSSLKWETIEQTDFGFDLQAMDGKLSTSVIYFDKRTKDLLLSSTPSVFTGQTSVFVNAGDVTNNGFEFDVAWMDYPSKDFNYSIKANLTTLSNEVTYLDPATPRIVGASLHTSTMTFFEEGYPVWYMRGYKFLDVDDETGDPIFDDLNGDGQITDLDKTYIGDAIPDFTYGITLSANYKNFDAIIFGAGSQGNDIFNALTRVDRPRGNRLLEFYDDRWTTENTAASRPRPGSNGEDKYWYSDALVYDGSFFKIKQIQLGYELPEKFLGKAGIGKARIYLSLDDWFVFTKYPGMDPEASAGSTSAMGMDKGSYPTYKKTVFGINITF